MTTYVTVRLTEREAQALVSAVAHAETLYWVDVEMEGRLTREESASRRALDRAARRLVDALHAAAPR